MKRITPETWELIGRLHREDYFLSTLLKMSGPIVEILEQIGATKEPRSIAHFAGLFGDRRADVREAAAHTAAMLMNPLSVMDLVQLDEICRSEWFPNGSDHVGIRRLTARDIEELSCLPHSSICIGIASFHPNGYVREEAVSQLGTLADGSELPFLLIRTNDWTIPVRSLAAKLVRERIRIDYAQHFLRCLSLVLRLEHCGRAQHGGIVSDIISFLKQPAVSPVLHEGFKSRDRWLKRACFRIVLEAGTSGLNTILKSLLEDEDPILRLGAARKLAIIAGGTEMTDILRKLQNDRYPPIRCEALKICVTSSSIDVDKHLWTALLDPNASVRAAARYYIGSRTPGVDIGSAYRNSLAPNETNPRQLRTAILGVGETGTAADCAQLLSYTNTSKVKIKSAAIRSIAALDLNHHRDLMMSALRNQSPQISREATDALRKHRSAIDFDAVKSLFRTESCLPVRKNTFNLLLLLPFWQRGVFLFEAIRDSDLTIVEMGLHELESWIGDTKSFACEPTGDELQHLEACLKASSGMLSQVYISHLKLSLQNWGHK